MSALLALLLTISLQAHGQTFATPEQAANAISNLGKQLHRKGDPRGLFAEIYATTISATAKSLARGEFKNAVWVSQLVVNYAEIYWRTIQLELHKKRHLVPVGWQWTFDYEDNRTDWGAGLDMVYGINVHIARDLVEALTVTPTDVKSKSVKQDFLHITDNLRSVLPKLRDIVYSYAEVDYPDWQMQTTMKWIALLRERAWGRRLAMEKMTAKQKQRELDRLDAEVRYKDINYGLFLPVSETQ